MNYNEYLERIQNQRQASQTIEHHPTSFGNSPKSFGAVGSLKRSTCSAGSIGKNGQRGNSATIQAGKYCPILRSNSLSSKPGTKRGSKPSVAVGTASSKGTLPPWNKSTNAVKRAAAAAAAHKRAKSHTSRPFTRTTKSSVSTPGVQLP